MGVVRKREHELCFSGCRADAGMVRGTAGGLGDTGSNGGPLLCVGGRELLQLSRIQSRSLEPVTALTVLGKGLRHVQLTSGLLQEPWAHC